MADEDFSSDEESPPGSSLDLRGSLILADPSLTDPNFERTVLLLTEHDAEDGALGFVLNRPLGKTVSEVLNPDEFSPLSEIPVYLGGPVSTGQLTFASFHWRGEQGLTYETHLSVDQAKCQLAEGFDVRAFVGYAGWTGGQLEAELTQNAWITRTPDDLVFTDVPPSKKLWAALLSSMGPFYKLLSDMPDDPTKN